MSQQWSVPVWAVVVLVAAALVLLVGLLLALRTAWRALADARHDTAGVAARVDELERRLAPLSSAPSPAPGSAPDRASEQEFVITHLGEADLLGSSAAAPVPVVPAPVFADLVLRESVVRAATLAAGLRRALAPETRHRIRFEMRREVKRARKQRRADLRTARRDLHARERAAA